MSAANAKVQEPSMEEILASIRRIIADDQNAKTRQESETQPEPATDDAAEDADDILDLAQVDAASEQADAAPHDLDDLDFRDPPPQREATPAPISVMPKPVAAADISSRERPAPVPSVPAPEAVGTERGLLAPQTDAAVSAAFGSLANTVLSGNARTLENLVEDMLRPMLKGWLDENLPGIVERLVRAEIERVARGGRG